MDNQAVQVEDFEVEDELQNQNRQVSNFFDMNILVIKKDSNWKGGFDVLMLFVSVYNIFVNAFYSAFGIPTTQNFIIVDNLVEGLFICDLCFCFCQEYLDEETYSLVSGIKEIAMHYLKKTFFVDLIACLPITYFLPNVREARLLRLLKLLRLPRLAQLFDVEKFKQIVYEIYNQELDKNLRNNIDKPYPILKALLMIKIYSICQLVIIILTCSYFLGIFWHIITKDCIQWDKENLYDVY
jgi:hypothetical protein